MTNPFLNRFNTIFRGSRVLIPFFSDLNTWYKRIVGTIFNESINNLPARFLPRVASFRGDDYIDTGIDLSEATSVEYIYLCNRSAAGTINAISQEDSSAKRMGLLWNSDNTIYCLTGNNSSGYGTISAQTQTGWFELKLVFTGGGATNADRLKLYIDNVLQTLTFFLDDIPTSLPVFTDKLLLGKEGAIFDNNKLSYVCITKNGTLQGLYYPTGQGSHEYDISGNNNHGTINGSGTHYDFDLNGSTRPNDVGYSIWRKASNPDIQVPFDINGAAISLTEGVNIPAGYLHERDVPAGGSNHNIYKSLVDMEYGSLLQCDTAGVAYATQSEAYGLVLDVILNKGSDGSNPFIHFIQENSNFSGDGYRFQFKFDEKLGLDLITNGVFASELFTTATSYVVINTDYRVLVWRNETTNQFVTGGVGTFVAYIQGKAKAITTKDYDIPNTNEMELVVVDSGNNPVTDNTYTTSNNMVIDNDAGDQISKIEVNGKYISPYDFTVSTGAYSIIDNAKNAIFNRTNATRQTATSRASEFFNVNFPFIYHIDEISDPRNSDTFFMPDFKNIVFQKVRTIGQEVSRLDELPNYATQKTGADLVKVQRYCGISNLVLSPEILIDGNTVAWYDAQILGTITKDGGNLVARWNDQLGSGHDLLQAIGARQPLWSTDGILFDGVGESMETVAFTWNQPEMIYIVFKQITWTTSDYIFDGNQSFDAGLAQSGTTPELLVYAGSASGADNNLVLDTFGIVRVLFNGVSSKLIINENTPITGNFGNETAGGFIIGANSPASSHSHIQVKEIILRKVADSAPDEAAIYAYLSTKYGI